MNDTALRRLGRPVLLAAVTGAAACAERAPLAPDRAPAASLARTGADRRVDLGACTRLQPPEGSRLAYHAYARGVQIYRWNGAGWSFVAPAANLSADAGGASSVGTHYAGPTWRSNSGGTVVGTVTERCVADPGAIPWLLLGATPDGGPGIFHRVAYIQRVNTVGGMAPGTAGSVVGEEQRVPYTAEYYFYRAP